MYFKGLPLRYAIGDPTAANLANELIESAEAPTVNHGISVDAEERKIVIDVVNDDRKVHPRDRFTVVDSRCVVFVPCHL